jgi:hypothetical protein
MRANDLIKIGAQSGFAPKFGIINPSKNGLLRVGLKHCNKRINVQWFFKLKQML